MITYRNIETCQKLGQRKTKAVIVFQLQVAPPPSAERIHDFRTVHHASVHKPNNRKLEIVVDRTAYRCRSTQCTYACFREGKFCVHFKLFLYCCKCFYYYFYLVSKIALNSLKGKYNYNRKSRKENPQKPTQLSSRSHPRHLVGKRTAQKTPS